MPFGRRAIDFDFGLANLGALVRLLLLTAQRREKVDPETLVEPDVDRYAVDVPVPC